MKSLKQEEFDANFQNDVSEIKTFVKSEKQEEFDQNFENNN